MGKTELIVRRFVVCYTKLVAGWFVGAHTKMSLQCHMKHGMSPMTFCKHFPNVHKMSLKHFKKMPFKCYINIL